MKFALGRIVVRFVLAATFFAAAFCAQPAGAQNAQGTSTPSTQATPSTQSAPSTQVTPSTRSNAAAQNPAGAQAGQGTLQGTVTDPSGAAVAQAAVVMMSSSGQFTTGKTNQTGGYQIKGLAPGSYTLTVNADGFSVYEQDNVQISSGQIQTANPKLNLASESQSVQVSGQAVSVAVNPEENASAVVIQGKDLAALSDDPDELQDELQALAGPSAGPNGGQIYIDGFQAGQLPPKSAIREIIINQNPFSAEYPEMGYGRIQILTKPGTDKLHGDFFVIGNDSSFNTLDPLIKSGEAVPPYHTEQFSGDVSGPMGKKASFFFQVEQRNIDQDSVVAASMGTGVACSECNITELNPLTRTTISPRLDFQLSKTNTITVRYQYTHSGNTNNGVGQFSLATQGYNVADTENTLQVTDDQTFGAKVLMETRFQFNGDNDGETAQNSTAEIQVPGYFTGGGNSIGREIDKENHYELDSFTQVTLSKNTVRFGARLDEYDDTNTSTSGFNSSFQFPSIAAYQTFAADSALGLSDAAIVAAGGGADQYTVTTGVPTSSANEFTMGLYAEDDWRIKPTITFSYGLRYETQTNISDHNDWAPRLSLSWAVGHSKSGPRTVLRAGYGIFYNRFNLGNTLDTERFNGTTQQQYSVTNPTFFPTDAPPPSSLPSSSTTSPTIYQVAPNLRAPYQMEVGGSVEQQMGKSATFTVTYINSHGLHQFLTDDVNAPCPGTYNPADPSSQTVVGAANDECPDPSTVPSDEIVRPLFNAPFGSGTYENDNVDQYQSEGIFHQNQIIMNLNYRLGSIVSLFGYYTLNYADSDTNGVNSFPSNPYDLMADYGRAAFDTRSRVFVGGTIGLPKGFRLNPLLVASSGAPFNITVGQDLLGDSQFNDRPGIAEEANMLRPSVIVTQKFGALDTDPIPGEPIIPINDGTGPALITFNLRISKTFSFGGEKAATATGQQGG
ncbi:MAG: carboxypeptidase regulatory-like domain-containing protein, partial [Candidatus Acidiferrales bacterium]